ncbi:MAG: hypothetical protein QOI20_141 [Acidimicrobiaceae bacterium]|jgi:hypothetical protein|nr:hypothetical protein [Acidimicrobiaceae bacterium]
MDEFCRLIINMLEQDYIQLWFVGEGDRTELYELPSDLAQRYAALAHTDPTFDPLGYSLTLGPKAVPESMPDWETDISFDKSTFLLLAKPSKQDQAFDQLARLFPDVRWVITDRAENSDGIRVAGRISPPEHRDA